MSFKALRRSATFFAVTGSLARTSAALAHNLRITANGVAAHNHERNVRNKCTIIISLPRYTQPHGVVGLPLNSLIQPLITEALMESTLIASSFRISEPTSTSTTFIPVSRYLGQAFIQLWFWNRTLHHNTSHTEAASLIHIEHVVTIFLASLRTSLSFTPCCRSHLARTEGGRKYVECHDGMEDHPPMLDKYKCLEVPKDDKRQLNCFCKRLCGWFETPHQPWPWKPHPPVGRIQQRVHLPKCWRHPEAFPPRWLNDPSSVQNWWFADSPDSKWPVDQVGSQSLCSQTCWLKNWVSRELQLWSLMISHLQ